MEEQPLESLPGSSNVELIIEPRAATALCTSDQWIFLAKGTALEVYDASELMDLVPLSPSKGVFHFPFIVELLVSLRDGFSGAYNRPLLDPLPPPYASPLAYPFLSSIILHQNNGVRKRERRTMLAGCLVNGILSVICIHVASVTTTPTRCRSDGKVENEEENHSHSFSDKELQLNSPQQLVQLRWASHNNLLDKIPLQQKFACGPNWNSSSASPNTSDWISNGNDELPVATSCHISAVCWLSTGILAVLMSCVDDPYSSVMPTHLRTYCVEDRYGDSLWMGAWRADFVHPQTIIATSSPHIMDCVSEGNDSNWDALLLAVSPREVTIYSTSGCLSTIPWQGHTSPITVMYNATNSSFIIATSSGNLLKCTYQKIPEDAQRNRRTLLTLTTGLFKDNNNELKLELEHHGYGSSPIGPIWLMTAIPRREQRNTNIANIKSNNNQCCFPARVSDNFDDTHCGKAKTIAAKKDEWDDNHKIASNYWLLVGIRGRLCTTFSLCNNSNSPKMCTKSRVPLSCLPTSCAINRISGAKDSGLELIIAGKDHLSLACRGAMMSILAQGDTGLDGGNLRLFTTTVNEDAFCYDLIAFSDSFRDSTYFMGVMDDMVEPIELDKRAAETTIPPPPPPQESFIQDESTIHLSYTGEWILQVTHRQAISLQQHQYRGCNLSGGGGTSSLLSTLYWKRKGHWNPFSPSRRLLIDHATSPLRNDQRNRAAARRNKSVIIVCTSMPDLSILTVGDDGRLNCGAHHSLLGAVAALTSSWSSIGSDGESTSGSGTSPNDSYSNKLLVAYSLWDSNVMHILEVGSGPIFLHRIEEQSWKWRPMTSMRITDKILIDGCVDRSMILEVWSIVEEEECTMLLLVNYHSRESSSLQISITPMICKSRRSKTTSHTNLSALSSCGEAFTWAERRCHQSAISSRELLNHTNTYFNIANNEENSYQHQKTSSCDSSTSPNCWRLYIGILTTDNNLGPNNTLPRMENTARSLISIPRHPQQCCYVTRTAKLKKCHVSVERILHVPDCQCIVVATRDTCGWYIALYDDVFLDEIIPSPTAIEGEITSLLLSDIPPAMNKIIKDHAREANQISDATALISVILLTKKIRFEENDGDEEIAYGDHKRIIHTGGIAEDHSILDIDESSVILMLQLCRYKDGRAYLKPCASLPLPGKGCYCACSLDDWCMALGIDDSITLVGWRSPTIDDSGCQVRWRLEEICGGIGHYCDGGGDNDTFNISNEREKQDDELSCGCVTALASTGQKGKKGGFLAAAFLIHGVTIYGYGTESPKLFALMVWKESSAPITCLGISWVFDSISIAVPEDNGIITICSAHVTEVGCDGSNSHPHYNTTTAQQRTSGGVEFEEEVEEDNAHDSVVVVSPLLQQRSCSFFPRLSEPLFVISHLKFPSGFIPSYLVLRTTEKGGGGGGSHGHLSSHHYHILIVVCAASGAVYEAAIDIIS